MKKPGIIFLYFFLLLQSCSNQRSIRIDSSEINRIVTERKDSLNIPGIAVGIAVGNEIKYKETFGFEDLDAKVDLSINSLWHICSVSKQFTTVACLKLAEENKLSLEDKISEYFDNLPEPYRDIKIYNLLSHTSGIKDYISEKGLYGSDWDMVMREVFSDTLNFNPGNAWIYSNTGFWAASKIIEKISGIDYHQYLDKSFFIPLKMQNTRKGEENMACVKGYSFRDNSYHPPEMDADLFRGQGDGEFISTLDDLLRWNIGLVHGKIINRKSLANMWCCIKLNNGESAEIAPGSGMNYGMGWFITKLHDKKIVWTPGSGFGFSTTSQYIPDYDLTIIVFCNKEQFLMADEIGFTIAREIMKQL